MKIALFLSVFFIVTACNAVESKTACRDTLSGIGISISERDSENDNITLDVTIDFQKSVEASPLFAYLAYANKNEILLKVPVFIGQPSGTDKINYSVLTRRQSLEYLVFETFYYLPGGKGTYLFVNGFSDIDKLQCSYTEP